MVDITPQSDSFFLDLGRVQRWPSRRICHDYQSMAFCVVFLETPVCGTDMIRHPWFLHYLFLDSSEINMSLFMYRVYPVTNEHSSCRTQRSAALLFSCAVKSSPRRTCTCRKNQIHYPAVISCAFVFCELTECDQAIFPTSGRSASGIHWFDYNWNLDWTHNYSKKGKVTWSGDLHWYCDGNSFNRFFWSLVQNCSRANSFGSRWHMITRLSFRNSDASHFKWCKSWYPASAHIEYIGTIYEAHSVCLINQANYLQKCNSVKIFIYSVVVEFRKCVNFNYCLVS